MVMYRHMSQSLDTQRGIDYKSVWHYTCTTAFPRDACMSFSSHVQCASMVYLHGYVVVTFGGLSSDFVHGVLYIYVWSTCVSAYELCGVQWCVCAHGLTLWHAVFRLDSVFAVRHTCASCLCCCVVNCLPVVTCRTEICNVWFHEISHALRPCFNNKQ